LDLLLLTDSRSIGRSGGETVTVDIVLQDNMIIASQ